MNISEKLHADPCLVCQIPAEKCRMKVWLEKSAYKLCSDKCLDVFNKYSKDFRKQEKINLNKAIKRTFSSMEKEYIED